MMRNIGIIYTVLAGVAFIQVCVLMLLVVMSS